jgi:two-component system sensor histidine kinase YesM
MIKVTGMEYGADIIFTVEDNGRGMNEQELSELKDLISGKKSNDRQHGFGMANVEKRIKMQYGEKYGMTVESTFGEGTIVTVRIPKV